MNISTGISEINIRGNDPLSTVSRKSFIWPKYHQGKVEKVAPPRQRDSEAVYFKPTQAEKDKLLGLMRETENEYNSNGRAETRRAAIQPGSFFSALA